MPSTAIAERKGAKLRPLNMRTTAALRTQLEAAAQSTGRSLTQEVERRLERSFEHDDAFGGPELRKLALVMIGAFGLAGQFRAGWNVPVEEWLQNTTACSSAIASVVDVLVRTLPGFDDADAIRRLEDTIAVTLAGLWASTGTAAGKATVRGAGAASYAGDRK
jgi:hypothetical protein